MSDYFKCYPFAAVTGQEQAKRAILIALVNHKAGGLLISGVTGTAKSVLVRGAAELSGDRKLLNLPLNVTEDMLFGSIDLEYAVTQGERRFEPGLLGRADGNIIYIDEVNLLRPELLTAVLDINMAGENRVERDGISFVHKTEYTVIGTMDPHEGVLLIGPLRPVRGNGKSERKRATQRNHAASSGFCKGRNRIPRKI